MVDLDPCSTRNLLLASLSRPDFERLAGQARSISLDTGDTLYETDDAIDHVYFPESGLLSIVSDLLSGDSVETSIVGRDGSLGFVEALGSGRIYSRVIVQVPGTAWIASAAGYREAFEASAGLRRNVNCLIELQLAELRQNAACLSRHELRPRLARWLLECDDRAGRPSLMPLTQEFLAAMLGTGRPSVSATAGQLQDQGLIAYTRGSVQVHDRAGLEHAACECRRVIQGLRQRILPESDRVFGHA